MKFKCLVASYGTSLLLVLSSSFSCPSEVVFAQVGALFRCFGRFGSPKSTKQLLFKKFRRTQFGITELSDLQIWEVR
jgi:hypothetical protein